MPSRHAGIHERRDAHGRTRYLVRVRRRGQQVTATLPTLAEALAWKAKAIAATDGTADMPEAPSRALPARGVTAVTLDDAARRLCRGMVDGTVRNKSGRTYKPGVCRMYELSLRLHVLPRVGTLPVATLRKGDVQRLVDEIAAAESVVHAQQALTALRVSLRLCESYGDIDTNPCVGVSAPRGDEQERPARILPSQEVAELVEAAEGDDATFGRSFAAPLVALAASSGLRLGELLALTWGREGLDLDAGVVRVRQSLDGAMHEGGRRIVPPKSRTSRRDVALPAGEVTRLRRHRLATGRPADGAFVFADELGRPLCPSGLPRSVWKRVSAVVDAPRPRFHDLRHSYATALLGAGVSPHGVAELLGHATAELVFERYGHPQVGEVARAGEMLEAFWHRNGTSLDAEPAKALLIGS